MPPRLQLSGLEDRFVPATADVSLRSLLGSTQTDVGDNEVSVADLGSNRLAIGGASGVVRIVDRGTQKELARLVPYGEAFTGGVRVAAGDITGDGVADLVTAPGAGGGPRIRAFDGVTFAPVADFFAYSTDFRGGVTIAVGDVNGDGLADIITGAGPGGGPHVRVFDGRTREVIRETFAFDSSFTGGVNVAAGDLDRDGRAEVVVAAGAGGGPRVRVFAGSNFSPLADFFATDPTWRGGVNVAVGDVTGRGRPSIVASANSTVAVFDGQAGAPLQSFDSGEPGVRVFVGDFTGDGVADLGTTSSRTTSLRVFGANLVESNRLVI